MAQAATKKTETPASEPVVEKTKEQLAVEASWRTELETVAPGEHECTGLWFPDARRLPNGNRECMLGGTIGGISSLSGRVDKIVMQVNGAVRICMEVTSGRLPAGTRNYIFFSPDSYQYVEAAPITPRDLGMLRR
jgi:hypothetical protein